MAGYLLFNCRACGDLVRLCIGFERQIHNISRIVSPVDQLVAVKGCLLRAVIFNFYSKFEGLSYLRFRRYAFHAQRQRRLVLNVRLFGTDSQHVRHRKQKCHTQH